MPFVITDTRRSPPMAAPHLAFPVARGIEGKLGFVEQGSEAHVMSCVQMIARTPLGYRADRPEFGWPWPDMRLMPVDPSPLIQAIAQFEPRATAVSVADAQALAEAAVGVDSIDLDVRMQVTNR